MVKKLFKYEIASWLKIMLPVEIAVLGTALFNRILQFFERDNTIYTVIFVSSVVLLCVAVFASFMAVYVIGVRRYYKNFFSREGYLTMSLPVPAWQLLLVKLLTALLFDFVAVFCAFSGACVTMLGEVFTEFFKAFGYVWNHLNKLLSYNLPALFTEIVLLLVFSSAKSLLVFYACISLGQTTKKNRVAMAVAFFFIYYFVMQGITTVFTVVISIQAEMGLLEEFLTRVFENPLPYMHLLFILICIWDMVFGVLYFILSHHVISKKLNLE